MAESKSKRLGRERRERIAEYIKQRMTSDEIADREGLESDYARRLRNKVAGKPAKETKRQPKPFGLTDATRQLRIELGNKLYDLSQTRKMHDLEIARDVGIPVRHQKVANDGKEPHYDWKLSQIERMSKVMGIDPNKLLVLAMRRELIKQAGTRKVGDLINEWVYHGTS